MGWRVISLEVMKPTTTNYLKGAAFGLAAVSIWASWSAITRLAVTTSLDAWDIVALRFGVAGLLLSPIVWRRGLALNRLGWLGLAGIIAGTGAPYTLVAAEGLRFAPAYDGGALNPAVMPLFVALIGAIVLREKLSATQKSGLLFILVGAVLMIGWHTETHGTNWDTSRTFGDMLFLLAACLTAIFTVITRQAKLDPIHAAALVSTGWLIIWLPFYFTLSENHLFQIPLRDLALQAIFQGVLVTIISLVLYVRSVAILGASGGAAFGALVPALTAFLAIPLLGEWPSDIGWVAIVLISAGVYLTSGGPLPRTQRSLAPLSISQSTNSRIIGDRWASRDRKTK
jgi:drug/metabolite transporter (DMT)-like permease